MVEIDAHLSTLPKYRKSGSLELLIYTNSIKEAKEFIKYLGIDKKYIYSKCKKRKDKQGYGMYIFKRK